MRRGKISTGIELYRKTKIFDKNMFACERSRVVVYLFLKNGRERFRHIFCEKPL